MQQHTSLPTTLVLIRHAQAADRDPEGQLLLSGQVDLSLTRHGRMQAERLRHLDGHLRSVQAIYTSTLRRAIDTARPLADELKLVPRAWPSLCEISCGRLDGMSVAQVRRDYPRLWHANIAQNNDDFCWPGGETYTQFRHRVLRAVQRIARTHAGGRVVIVTHAGVISQIVGYLTDEPAARWEVFRPYLATLTEMRWRGRTGVLVHFGDAWNANCEGQCTRLLRDSAHRATRPTARRRGG